METRIVDVPRQPDVEQKRRVHLAVLDNYDIDNQRYYADWTDEKLANKLNVPRAWVTNIRELFGPETNNNQEQLAGEVTEYVSKCKKLEEDALEVASRAEELTKLGDRLQEKLGLPVFPRKVDAPAAKLPGWNFDQYAASIPPARKRGRRLKSYEKEKLAEEMKAIIVEANSPLQVGDILASLEKQGIIVPSSSRKAALQRLKKILHSGKFERIGDRREALWWPIGHKQT